MSFVVACIVYCFDVLEKMISDTIYQEIVSGREFCTTAYTTALAIAVRMV